MCQTHMCSQTRQAGLAWYLDEPRLELVVDHDVVAEDLKAVLVLDHDLTAGIQGRTCQKRAERERAMTLNPLELGMR